MYVRIEMFGFFQKRKRYRFSDQSCRSKEKTRENCFNNAYKIEELKNKGTQRKQGLKEKKKIKKNSRWGF